MVLMAHRHATKGSDRLFVARIGWRPLRNSDIGKLLVEI